MASLVEIDSLEIEVIVDNEVDPMSAYNVDGLEVSGRFADVAMGSPHPAPGRAEAQRELHLGDLCCGAHGLSLMIVSSEANYILIVHVHQC
jgi:7,8-dihydropterin-6-yl-methyl-4-(beta-D-ribofuranosyl)aminobenzene 5'-phosphate synthase